MDTYPEKYVNDEIDLVEMVRRLCKNIKWMIASVLVCVLLAGGYIVFSSLTAEPVVVETPAPEYSATTRVYYLYSYLDIATGMGYSLEANISADLKAFAKLRVVAQPIYQEFEAYFADIACADGEPFGYDDFLACIAVEVPSNTHLLYVTITHPDAQVAVDVSNALSEALCEYVAEMMSLPEPTIIEVAALENVVEITVAAETVVAQSGMKQSIMMVVVAALAGVCLSGTVIVIAPAIVSFVKAVREDAPEQEEASVS